MIQTYREIGKTMHGEIRVPGFRDPRSDLRGNDPSGGITYFTGVQFYGSSTRTFMPRTPQGRRTGPQS